jgi:hypothetical protein
MLVSITLLIMLILAVISAISYVIDRDAERRDRHSG